MFVDVASSAETLIVLFVTNTSIPSPPSTVKESVRRFIVSDPESPAIERFVATSASPAAVNLPCSSTVNVGIFVVDPYEPAVTAVLSRSTVIVFRESLYVFVSATPATIALFTASCESSVMSDRLALSASASTAAVESGLLASEVLSTFPRPTSDLTIPVGVVISGDVSVLFVKTCEPSSVISFAVLAIP